MLKKIFVFITQIFLRLYCATLRVHIVGLDRFEARLAKKKPSILALWHDQLIPLTYSIFSFNDKKLATIASDSKDGDFITNILQSWGYQVARGSSTRGGAKALIAAKKLINAGYGLAITLDGPTGPRHKVKPGVIYIAKKSGATITPLLYNCNTAYRFNSWDKMTLPLPFSHIYIYFCDPVEISSDMDEDSFERDRLVIEKLMLEHTNECSPDLV